MVVVARLGRAGRTAADTAMGVPEPPWRWPGIGDGTPPFLVGIRAEVGLAYVRLHDLRHSHASLAFRHGETVPVIGRLPRHLQAATTLGYAHPADGTARDAVEALGAVPGDR